MMTMTMILMMIMTADDDDDVLDDDVQVFRSRPHGPRDQPLGHLLQQEHQLPLLCTDHQVD